MTINIPENCTWLFNVGALAIIYALCHYMFKINRMYKTFPKIVSALTRISEALFQQNVIKEPVFTTESPLKLTPAGEKIVQDSEYNSFIEANRSYLFNEIKKLNPISNYDIEEAAKKVMLEIPLTVPKIELIKDYAYNNGIPLATILMAYSIPLRDEMIKKIQADKQPT